uniref:Uncharacterized protein n=1 Tax=Rhizophora mucronata TaxID=61149 RepID=A0A2P2PNH8_RHIMU
MVMIIYAGYACQKAWIDSSITHEILKMFHCQLIKFH